jgi:glycerol-1-phosphate dehydrogenase [NAD(P)+]
MQSAAVGNEINDRVNAALWPSAMTQQAVIGAGALDSVADCVRERFSDAPVVVVADRNTYTAAGNRVQRQLSGTIPQLLDPFLFEDAALYAEYTLVERLRNFLRETGAVAIAVGAGTINDLAKLASGELQRPYMSVATAASMDGYTSFGASVTFNGCKQTLPCSAPLAVVVDLDVLSAAPPRLNAAGYADLLAKVPSGADWIVADAIGAEPIDAHAWSLVQDRLKNWLADPAAVRRGDRAALAGLVEGLIMTGLGMQYTNTTRPASGAEHQFSHLWDMQHHTHDGAAPMHGEKVGIGSIASAAIYERVLQQESEDICVDENAVRSRWPNWDAMEAATRGNFADPLVADQIVAQQRGKYVTADELVARLKTLRATWPQLRDRLRRQSFTAAEVRDKLHEVGAPYEPEQIGITRERLRGSHRIAQQIRNRYTVLDLVYQAAWWDNCVESQFQSGGVWAGRIWQ